MSDGKRLITIKVPDIPTYVETVEGELVLLSELADDMLDAWARTYHKALYIERANQTHLISECGMNLVPTDSEPDCSGPSQG